MAKTLEKKEKKEKNVKKVSKEAKKKKAKKAPKENYFKGVNKELKLVKWPTFGEVIKYTVSTIVFCLILCALFMFLNYLLALVKGAL